MPDVYKRQLYSSGLGSSDGGGICQVSTALYIAAVKADLEIVERHPHSVPSDYAPIGLDATIVYGSRDLRIKNNTDFPITIYAKAVGQTVSVNLLGKPCLLYTSCAPGSLEIHRERTLDLFIAQFPSVTKIDDTRIGHHHI